MPKIPRGISSKQLSKLLKTYKYEIKRQTGSHIRLVSNLKGTEHKITIPDHKTIKIGTLNNIINDVSSYLSLSKDQLIKELFEKS